MGERNYTPVERTFRCVPCKRIGQGLSDEQPPGWAWRPVQTSGIRFDLECHDCKPAGPIWEIDDSDYVPREGDLL